MPAYNYSTWTSYFHEVVDKRFVVIDIEEHEFDRDLTKVELVWEDGEWQGIYADDFGHDVRPVNHPSLDEAHECDCAYPAVGENNGEMYCLACGGR